MSSVAQPTRLAGLRYGALGFPLAFVALPLYVYMPAYYAAQFGASLAALGTVLLLVRVFDAVTDPLMGFAADRLLSMQPTIRLMALGLGSFLLLAGFVGLFFPPLWARGSQGALLVWCAAMLVVTYLAYSALTITHQAWAARLQGGDLAQSHWVSWREAATLLGVLTASVLPSVAGMPATAGLLGAVLLLAWLALKGAPLPGALSSLTAAEFSFRRLGQPWRGSAFRGLMAVFLLNGIASAIPATLLLFFVNDRLQAQGWEGLFLAAYFACAAVSLPLWVRLVARVGLGKGWLSGMLLAILSFAGAVFLGSGDIWPFLLICMASGLALGADLALPTPLLARVIRQESSLEGTEGAYFGWWNSASKLNLALAAGLVLPLLQALGYRPGQQSEEGLLALTLAYAVVPCVLKLLAWIALWRWRQRWDKES